MTENCVAAAMEELVRQEAMWRNIAACAMRRGERNRDIAGTRCDRTAAMAFDKARAALLWRWVIEPANPIAEGERQKAAMAVLARAGVGVA